jgi:O-antigen/teichoic acid export membrane protein
VVALVLCLIGAPVVALALNSLVEFGHNRRWLLPALSLFDWDAGTILMRDGLMFLILQVGAIALSALDPLIASTCLGLTRTADFAVAHRLFMFIVPIQGMWLMPFWPAYGEAIARGDTTWARKTLVRTTALAGGSSALLGAGLTIFRIPIFSIWLHRPWAPPLDLCLALALCTVALSAGMAASMYLNGANAIREQAGVVTLTTVVVVTLKIWLCKTVGAAGIPWGMLIGYTCITGPLIAVIIRRRLRASQLANSLSEAK